MGATWQGGPPGTRRRDHHLAEDVKVARVLAVLQLDLVVAIVEPQHPGPGRPRVAPRPRGRRLRQNLEGGNALGVLKKS